MTQLVMATRMFAGRLDKVWLAMAAVVIGLWIWDANQATESLVFVGDALVGVSIFLLASIAIAAYAKASGADALIARAFSGNMSRMIIAAAITGALSPFCSCGVIPLIAALLAMAIEASRKMLTPTNASPTNTKLSVA